MAMRNKQKEKRLAQEQSEATEGIRLRTAADPKGDLRTGRLRGWSDSEEGQGESKSKRKKRRSAVTSAAEHDLEEGGHFHARATPLGQPGTYEEPPLKRRKETKAHDAPKEKRRKGTCEKEAKETKETKDKHKEKKEKKKKKKEHGEYADHYGMLSHTMLAPMMGMMRYPMMHGMMMMPGGLIGAPLMGGVGPLGMHGAPTMPYPLAGVPMIRPPKAPEKKKEEKRRRFTEAPAPAPAASSAPEQVAEAEEPEKRSASVSSSSSSSTSEAKNAGAPAASIAQPALVTEDGAGEGELELGLISPEPEDKEKDAEAQEHSPLQVPPGMESPVASPSPKDAEEGWPRRPSSWVEVEGESMEELQRELEVTCQNKPCVSVATQTEQTEQTDDAAEELSQGLEDRWFSGFVDAAMPVAGAKESQESSSSDSSDEAEDEATCRPERQLRRRSRSQSAGPETKEAAEEEEASSSSSSSSTSSGGSRKRQRAPSSDEEAAKVQSQAPEMPPVDPRRLRVVQDYSDVF